MEVKIEVVKPNLHVVEGDVYFGVDISNVVPASRAADSVIQKHIGTLKVHEEHDEDAHEK